MRMRNAVRLCVRRACEVVVACGQQAKDNGASLI